MILRLIYIPLPPPFPGQKYKEGKKRKGETEKKGNIKFKKRLF
jgi:hypothetical protein